ncbi:hypothetical protein ABB37_03760 [Leptomonas pyrrhocoris]|uniref:Uncharacterized protein n=1 Tax=Leptomonas pyrrhocoris TaxID=157538 RepID=A0A0N0DWC6_LEPPY|nr:hypothetical protein ABB37_03760 [Leptomonas pyrrhocoris]KPA81381.1 hypothetical protein ABB37_03760 [Leptomonas pyrrhocoris]|eukprot:XP_015659820.1 hypothetical protein ABB37_03760 [Leptomonas pyrrhocoris]
MYLLKLRGGVVFPSRIYCTHQVQKRFYLIKSDKKKDEEIEDVELVPIFEHDQVTQKASLPKVVSEQQHGCDCDEPLSKHLMNTVGGTPYRVSWYEFQSVSPAKQFVYWAYRRLRDLPPEWQEYYRRMLYQEVAASRYVNQTWDCFLMVVDGYRKAKWVLRKYGVKVDESLIPRPYNNFWEETTHEERVWAHRRSHQMKELQAMQRDDDEIVFGANVMDRKEVSYSSMKNLQTGMQGGTPIHAHDLSAPKESDLTMSRQDEEMSSALMSSIEDDKLWNPVLKSRLHTRRQRDEVELYAFEDDDENCDDDTSGAQRTP